LDEIAELLSTFHAASLGLLKKLLDEQETMKPEDVEKTKYVIGMAAINTFNLEQVAKHGASYYQDNKEKVDRLIAEATIFAKALQESGFGRAA
jgi:hypothetical protein